MTTREPIEWDEAWNTGIAAIDSDHQTVIRLINELREASAAEGREGLGRSALKAMLDYASYHFLREEGLMEDCGYPDFFTHQEKHRAFANAVRNRLALIEDDPDRRIGDDFHAFLERWWVSHILQEDMAYRDCVRRGHPE